MYSAMQIFLDENLQEELMAATPAHNREILFFWLKNKIHSRAKQELHKTTGPFPVSVRNKILKRALDRCPFYPKICRRVPTHPLV